MLTWILGWWREAPYYQIVLGVIAVSVVVYLIPVVLNSIRQRFSRPSNPNIATSNNEQLLEIQYQRRAEVISRLQELLVENERAFQLWTQPFVDDQGDLRERAREVYSTLYDYYRANTIWLDRQSCDKIEDYLDINHDVLSDLLMLTEPSPTLREWNLPDNPGRGEMRSSAVRRVLVELPNLRREIEEGFREVLGQP